MTVGLVVLFFVVAMLGAVFSGNSSDF
jgi:hypothetical protein